MVARQENNILEKNKIIVANWKMYGSYEFAIDYFKTICDAILPSNFLFVICPPYPYLGVGARMIAEHQSEQIAIGAQNVSRFTKLSSTGDVSVEMLEDCMVKAVIVGHTERRAIGETNDIINKKLKLLQNSNIAPILCIGENEEEYKNKKTEEVLKSQIRGALKDIRKLENLMIAYEPIWAIGTGKTPTQAEIYDISKYIENEVEKICKVENLYLLYGGSVNEDNIDMMLQNDNIDGLMLGGFSRETKKFCDFFENLAKSNWKK